MTGQSLKQVAQQQRALSIKEIVGVKGIAVNHHDREVTFALAQTGQVHP
jgi:hypothetical protein